MSTNIFVGEYVARRVHPTTISFFIWDVQGAPLSEEVMRDLESTLTGVLKKHGKSLAVEVSRA